MSLVGTLGKIAVGVMVAKTATSVIKGARGGSGGGLGGMLGNALGGGQNQQGGGLGGGFALSTPSKWAKVRPENAVFQERVFEIDFENWTQAELEIECGTLCRMACQEGHPTLFTPSEEAGLVKHCLSVLPRWPPWRPS